MNSKVCIIIIGLYIPTLWADERGQLLQTFKNKNTEQVFTDIYNNNYWMGWESLSWQRSNKSTTAHIRSMLPHLLRKFDIKTMVDAPCGDFNWMQYVIGELNLTCYFGIDIVQTMIERNNMRHAEKNRFFICANLINCIPPRVDLILSRDCLAHLSYEDGIKVLKNFKASGSTYLLTSHHIHIKENKNIVTGDWYGVNLCLKPFYLKKPLCIIVENTEPASRMQGKVLALWRLDEIDVDAMG